jgi:Fe-S cluster biogenesis protein NfuA
MSLGFRMHAERTPNPNSVKWVLGQPVVEAGSGVGSVSFAEAPGSAVSPLAARLFEVEGVVSVLLGPDFITVSKQPEREWTDLAQPIVAGIKAWAGSGESSLGPAWEPPDLGEQGEIVSRIRKVIEEDVQPYVAMDGGEIAFAGFHDGVVEVYLRGACAGCPSSTMTLKMGIEARLKEEVPQVLSVVAL